MSQMPFFNSSVKPALRIIPPGQWKIMRYNGWHKPKKEGFLGGGIGCWSRRKIRLYFFLSLAWKALKPEFSVRSSCSVRVSGGSLGFFCYFSSFWFVWNVPLMMCKDQTDDTSVWSIFLSAHLLRAADAHLHKAALYVPDSDSAAWHRWAVFTIRVYVFRQQYKVCSLLH